MAKPAVDLGRRGQGRRRQDDGLPHAARLFHRPSRADARLRHRSAQRHAEALPSRRQRNRRCHLGPDQMRIFDTLSTTDASVTVVDVRAGLLSPTLRALRDIGFLDAVKKGQITFVVFHILGSSIASLNEIEETAPFTADAKYFLVKNFINNTSFFEWDQADPFLLLQEAQGRRRDHHPEAQRDGLRAGRARFGSVPHLRRQQGLRRAKPPITRSCCAAMSGTGSAMSGPSTIASSSTTSSTAPPARPVARSQAATGRNAQRISAASAPGSF